MNCGRLSLRRLHTKRTLWKSAESPPECPCGLDELRVRTALLILPGKSERWSPDICIQPLTLHWESQHGETRFRCRKWGVCKMSIWGFYKILLVNKSMYSNTINLCDEVEEGRSIYVCDHRPMMLLEKIYNHRNICKLLLLTLWEIFLLIMWTRICTTWPQCMLGGWHAVCMSYLVRQSHLVSNLPRLQHHQWRSVITG